MKKVTMFLLIVLSSVSAYGQGTTTKVRSSASLPATCSSGSATVAADEIVVAGVLYNCIATNTWASVRGLEIANIWTNNNSFKGPAPWTDVTAFGARAVNGLLQTTAKY